MTSPRDLVLLALLALALGVAIPLMLQAFLALRDARRTMARLEGRITPALRDVEEVAALLRRRVEPASLASGLVEALIPAAVAAIRAFRASMVAPGRTEETVTATGEPAASGAVTDLRHSSDSNKTRVDRDGRKEMTS